jgi:rare lipoprotein A
MALELHDGGRARTRWAARAVHWGGLTLALVECRTPPPIARTPDDPPASRALVPDDAPPPAPAATAPSAAPPEPATVPPDYSSEQRELVERYARRRSQGVLHGEASYYGASFAGRKTASGEVFEPRKYTAAHRTLPFGTVLRVMRLDTRAIVYVRVNDRGPYGKKGRILDLSTAAAESLDFIRRGVVNVRADIVERGTPPTSKKQKHSSAKH